MFSIVLISKFHWGIIMFQALLSCPTSSIHTEKPAHDVLEVQKTFPIPINEQRIPVLPTQSQLHLF